MYTTKEQQIYMENRLHDDMEEAEVKAIDALARYKFYMFGYHAAQWVLLNRVGRLKKANPFAKLVKEARIIDAKNKDQKQRKEMLAQAAEEAIQSIREQCVADYATGHVFTFKERTKPTFIGAVLGVKFYECPIHGDEAPLLIKKGDGYMYTHFHELPNKWDFES